MRAFHRLYNPATKNPRAAHDIEFDHETVYLDQTNAPAFLYVIRSPSVAGDNYDYVIKSLGGMELRSGSAGSKSDVKKKLLDSIAGLQRELSNERAAMGMSGPFEAQTYTESETIFPGETFKAPADEYAGVTIYVRREEPGEDPGYYYFAATDDGEYQAPLGGWAGPIPSQQEAESRAHIAAGTIAGMRDFMQSNPRSRKKMAKWVGRRKNPIGDGATAFVKSAVSPGEIHDLPPLLGIPADPYDAVQLGYYMGVLRGIATCGVTKTIDRFKIKRKINKLLKESFHELAEQAILPRTRGRRARLVR